MLLKVSTLRENLLILSSVLMMILFANQKTIAQPCYQSLGYECTIVLLDANSTPPLIPGGNISGEAGLAPDCSGAVDYIFWEEETLLGTNCTDLDISGVAQGFEVDVAHNVSSARLIVCRDTGEKPDICNLASGFGSVSDCEEDRDPPICALEDITVYLNEYGFYTIDVSYLAATELIGSSDVGVIGSAVDDGPFVFSDTDLVQDMINADRYYAVMYLDVGFLKFRQNNNWIINWGDNETTFPVGTAELYGDDIFISNAGNYFIEFNKSTLEYSFTGTNYAIVDNCGIEEINLSQESFNCDDLGGSGVNVQVILNDINGLESSCSATVTVMDTLAPQCSNNEDITIQLDPGECERNVFFRLPIASDNCDPSPISSTILGQPQSGDSFKAGIHTIYYEVEDNNGNSTTCSFDIIVNDFLPDGMICRNINVSLDDDCYSVVTPLMVLANPEFGCPDNLEITIWDPHGHDLGNHIDDAHLGEEHSYMICHTISGLCCWGTLIPEDKYPPKLECDRIVVSACNGLDDVLPPTAEDNCSMHEVRLIDEKIDVRPCDIDFIKVITRTYIAIDASGAESDPCIQEIYLSRPIITEIIFPPNTSVYCNEDYDLTPEGYPAPSRTGVPKSPTGESFYPDVPDNYCNTLVSFIDTPVTTTNCKRKIMRSWEIREWWCTNEKTFGGVQFIEIVDHSGPVFDMPDDMYATTSYLCEGQVHLPALFATDSCGSVSGYSVEFPGGTINTNGGTVMLPIGKHNITYTVYDACYNSSTGTMVVNVEDDTPPVAACEQNTVVSIPREGKVDVIADVFDDGSWDDCNIHSYEARRMDVYCNPEDTLWGASVEFCCDDVGLDLMVALLVTDYEGNTNMCMVNVHVQDKIVPTIHCAEDTIIECQFPYDLNNLDISFGTAWAEGNCNDVPILETVETDLNQCGLGTIKRIFTIDDDNGNTISTCYQIITVINNNPFNPGSIIWPQPYTTTDACEIEGLIPDNLDALYAQPTYLDDQCDLLGHNYEDEVFDFTLGAEACVKILRTWTVINWCQKDDDGNFRSWTAVQEIKLNNTSDPEILGDCEDFVKCSFDILCLPGIVDLEISAQDDCTPDSLLKWTYVIDLFSDDQIDTVGYTNNATDTFPIGVHKIFWSVLDRCGNEDRCEYTFELRNCTAPTPVCIQGLSVDLVPMDTIGNDNIPDAEMATVWASDFDASSFHICDNDITFSFSEDTLDIFRTYDCDDLGLNVVNMWVTDRMTGAQDFCQTFIDVQDNNSVDICPPTTNGPRISGYIYTEMAENIEEVSVHLLGSELSDQMTDLEGSYAFEDASFGKTYTVDPEKNDEPLNGVSTLDLVMIQRHILGSRLLDTPYKMLAADVNNDQSVSSIDLIELRKLILGVYPDYPENESWRFVDAQYDFVDNSNPWAAPISEEYNIGMFVEDMEIDFVGIKVGDVNNSAETNLIGKNTDSRGLKSVALYAEDVNMQAGNYYTIDLNAVQDIDLSGLQLSFKTKGIDVSRINSSIFEMDENHMASIGEEHTTLSIHTNESKSISKGNAIMTLTLLAKEDISFSDAIEINSDITKAEAYNAQLELMNLSLEFRRIDQQFVLHQNRPNPWKESTEISFELLEANELSFRFYNTIGALLYQHKGNYNKGSHSITISSEDLQTDGVIIYEVIVGDEKYNKKMIMLR